MNEADLFMVIFFLSIAWAVKVNEKGPPGPPEDDDDGPSQPMDL